MGTSTAPNSTAEPAERPVRVAAYDDRLAETLLARLHTGVPPFTALPRRLITGDVQPLIRLCLRWAMQRPGGDPLPDLTTFLQAAAVRWARAELPLEQVLHALHTAVGAGLELVLTRLDDPGRDDVVTWTTVALELSDLCTSIISTTYVRELQSAAAHRHTAAHTLASALLGGHATSKVARECGIPIAGEYFVLAVHLAPPADRDRTGADRHVVAGRRLRRIQAGLAREFRGQALAVLSTDGGTVLIPAPACTEAELERAVDAVGQQAETAITAIVTRSAPESIPAAAQQTHELLDTTEAIGIGAGLHKFDDLALQYQLTRPGIARTILETRIAPLDDHPELMETLRVFFQTDLNRRRTARQLNIHPNTIDYRLRKIGQLTGLNPSRSQGLWYLRSALIARAGALEPSAPRRSA
ncbi:PucR family transcriptional regulator [Nocardia veterana]|nr:helix-turn-helix domain-containing protein [Nocardia veterana]